MSHREETPATTGANGGSDEARKFKAPPLCLPSDQNEINFLPLPPRSYGKALPVSVDDAYRVIDAYNRWADLWNLHERSGWPVRPQSGEGWFCCPPRVRSAFLWLDYATGRKIIIRVAGWHQPEDNSLVTGFLRLRADIDRVAWAGWLS
ncbi:hypothetical protein MnTg02_02599 [bacterium MnTg02]|nr:hypothetical protein MnTg02_02599 [bacterium MnTg02]